MSGFSSTMGFVGSAVARWKEAVLNDLGARTSGSTGLGNRRLFGRDSARISFLDGLSPLVGSMTMYKDFVEWQGNNIHYIYHGLAHVEHGRESLGMYRKTNCPTSNTLFIGFI